MKSLLFCLIASVILFRSGYEGSTTASVTLVGGIIKSSHIEPSDKKYKRKDCPVCKGSGKYLSGDGIKMVDCGYCEPDKMSPPENGVIKSGTISQKIICGPNGCRVIR